VTLRELLEPLERPLLGFDLETTHTNKDIARIVELGIEIMIPGKPTKEYRTYVNPTIPIPPASTAIHGITDAQVADAPTFEQLADNLLKGFVGADFGGYNIRFDLRIIGREFKRARRMWSYDDARVIDFFRTWQVVEPRSLDDAVDYWIGHRLMKVNPELARAYQQEIADAGKSHGAMRDVIASMRVGAAQMICCEGKLPRDMQKLHDLCWPGWFDAEGKLQWRDGQLCIMFGAHREKSLRQVPRDYLHWMAYKGDFEEKVKEVCRAAIKGEFPEPVMSGGIEDADDET
jgi:DNA polymerase-3 subunit epsilon